ncbi:valine--tRNA ligase [Edaphosphingomonas haloaromaticamans]|uniref:Valine--tRNA ligase n=1 Tax=Edaphosphingomonas haloaromaticamans TaxID=653954 RepID=A0A1S1HEV3_9SPHN|nr:valine--tRNA ligase [Sphingomonas haloaromaticamans]OHT19040.1 Valine--tRNA ligase [Sphingomonas haloaromaticamans]
MTELAKTFDPAAIEARWYAHWEGEGRFRPERPDAEPYTIVMPPPNVTGSLHIGHALDNSLQDILIRHARLQGKDALWVAGTDHAGIATQMVVERQMNARGEKRTDYSREDFVAKVWEWKAESGGQITRQLRRLGASCDWANERFTMDEGFSRAVIKVFVDLYNQGLLYRDKRLVNWDPGLKTAISDLEVETREVSGRFWHFAYPLEDGSGTITVATTRPETMLADMAVAVNPEDERYIALIGKNVRLPITGRLIPIVADAHADPELGSGAVKITPGHDFNDFEVGKRAGFRPADMLNMLDADAKVVQTADGLIPDEFLGLDRFDARKLVIERLKQDGVLIPHVDKDGNAHDGEPRTIQTPYGDRSGVVIEPWLTDQWYVDAETLAKPAIAAVRDGDIRVVPETWKKTWFNWLENIQPWCVSRQLWWGHQIPAWYDEDGQVYVAEDEAAAQALAGNKAITRDSDVLDTWFSSALWPFGTLGWPEDTAKLAKHYPNDVLISGFDILFFWDARMAMQGLHFMKEVPWKTLYLHGLVRDAQGQKMSKSKGNTVDPLGLIDKYGADALRFTLAAMESQGRDIKLDEKRVEGYRNFATKLWNAARFCQSNGIGASATLEPPAADLAVNRWIIAETVKTVQALDIALADLRFDESANSIYQFVWATFCDWYLELIKPLFAEEGAGAAETRTVAGWVLDQILVMLHPFMPFITEELWHALGERPYDLILAKWPMADARALDPAAQKEIDWLIRLVSEVRAARSELNVPPGARTELLVLTHATTDAGHLHSGVPSLDLRDKVSRNRQALYRLARIDTVTFFNSGTRFDLQTGASRDRTSDDTAATSPGLQLVVDQVTYMLPLEGVIDLAAEKARLAKAIAAAEKERDSLTKRLESPGFAEKAKPEAVAKARTDHAERSAEVERLGAALKRLG